MHDLLLVINIIHSCCVMKIGACNIGVNPKVNNLVSGYNDAKYGIIWILDSNVHTNEYCLARSIAKLISDPKIGNQPCISS